METLTKNELISHIKEYLADCEAGKSRKPLIVWFGSNPAVDDFIPLPQELGIYGTLDGVSDSIGGDWRYHKDETPRFILYHTFIQQINWMPNAIRIMKEKKLPLISLCNAYEVGKSFDGIFEWGKPEIQEKFSASLSENLRDSFENVSYVPSLEEWVSENSEVIDECVIAFAKTFAGKYIDPYYFPRISHTLHRLMIPSEDFFSEQKCKKRARQIETLYANYHPSTDSFVDGSCGVCHSFVEFLRTTEKGWVVDSSKPHPDLRTIVEQDNKHI